MDWKVQASKRLVELLDTKDFGWWSEKSNRIHQIPSEQIDHVIQLKCYKQRLTQKLIRSHIDGRDKIHYRSRANSSRILLRIESDAHHGERDARSAIEFVDQFYCGGGLYIEPSDNGFSGYVIVDVGAMEGDHYFVPSPAEINRAISIISSRIAKAAEDAGYQSKIEVQGGINELKGSFKRDPFGPFNTANELNETTVTVSRRAQTGRLPRFPKGEPDFKDFLKSPVVSLWKLLDWDTGVPKPRVVERQSVLSFGDEPNAYKRMVLVRNKLASELGRVPELEELLIRYEEARGTPSHGRRVARAKAALKWQARHFDPSMASSGGYEAKKSDRTELVANLMAGMKPRWRRGVISVEDAAIVLSAVEKSSFQIADKPTWQFTCGLKAIMSYAKALFDAGLTDRGFGDRDKASSTLRLLEDIGLVQCLDEKYKFAGPNKGINRKWGIGVSHPRYQEWLSFAEGTREPADEEPAPTEAANPLYVCVYHTDSPTLEDDLGWGTELPLDDFDAIEIGRPALMLSG